MSKFLFQDSNSEVMSGVKNFHDYLLLVMSFIFFFVGFCVYYIMWTANYSVFVTHKTFLEMFWTLVPAFLLLSLAMPSLRLLFLSDKVEKKSKKVSVSVEAHQWYWTYLLKNFEFDSYMVKYEDLNFGDYRLLEVDMPLYLKFSSYVNFFISSSDMLHSFALPSLSMKLDAVPGRINYQNVNLEFPGVFYGQCSEICGANHSFMPMSLEVV